MLFFFPETQKQNPVQRATFEKKVSVTQVVHIFEDDLRMKKK